MLCLVFFGTGLYAQDAAKAKVDRLAAGLEKKVVEWRRHFHQNPELSNREFKTAEKIAEHLRALGLEVQTGVAKTGVVGILKGGKPGPVIALRADIDGLPVTERTDVPFKSEAKGVYKNKEVGVMHACGHDTHIAILLGTAELLSKMKDDLPATVKFIFQPAEEGSPEGEEGGADLMVREGVLKNPDAEVIFGLHINSQTEVGKITYKARGTMAAADVFKIKITGSQTHGAYPWAGVDPIVTGAQIITALQTVVSRNAMLIKAPAVVTVGRFEGGVRNNIIPETAEMEGTIRTFDPEMQEKIHANIRRIAVNIAESAGAKAEVEIRKIVPVTFNDPDLVDKMLPSMREAAGAENVEERLAVTGAEDFAFYQEKIPGFFFFLGGMEKGKTPAEVAPHHTPDFYIDDSGLILGVKTFAYMVLDYAEKSGKKK